MPKYRPLGDGRSHICAKPGGKKERHHVHEDHTRCELGMDSSLKDVTKKPIKNSISYHCFLLLQCNVPDGRSVYSNSD